MNMLQAGTTGNCALQSSQIDSMQPMSVMSTQHDMYRPILVDCRSVPSVHSQYVLRRPHGHFLSFGSPSVRQRNTREQSLEEGAIKIDEVFVS